MPMNNGYMLKNIENEFERHLVDCHDSKQAHFDLADYYYDKANLIYYAQSFGLASITAWLLTNQYNGLLPLEHPAVKATPTVLSIIVSILTILEHVFRFKEKALIHELAAKRYHTLWRTCKNWKTDFPDESTIEQARFAVQKCREQLNEINRDAPHLSSIMWKRIDKIRKKKGYKDVSKYTFEERNEKQNN
jgi:hypothetical protein